MIRADFLFSSSVDDSKQNDENVERNIAYVVPQLTTLKPLQLIERNHLRDEDVQKYTDLTIREEIGNGRELKDVPLRKTVQVY